MILHASVSIMHDVNKGDNIYRIYLSITCPTPIVYTCLDYSSLRPYSIIYFCNFLEETLQSQNSANINIIE